MKCAVTFSLRSDIEGLAMIRLHGPRLFALLAVVLFAAPAFAHPGHGIDGSSNSLTHYVTEPAHLGPVILAAVAGITAAAFVAWYRRRA
jgi:hydrogenase/urease accessory protein HupE